jgi:type IV secretion system protein TrbL
MSDARRGAALCLSMGVLSLLGFVMCSSPALGQSAGQPVGQAVGQIFGLATPAPTPYNGPKPPPCTPTTCTAASNPSQITQKVLDGLGQINPLATISQVTSTGNVWFNRAKDLALKTFGLLFVIEIFMFGLQFTLMKDKENLGEIFASLSFKVLSAGFFIYLISNADTIFFAVIQSFQKAGQSIAQTDQKSLEDVLRQGFIAGGLYFGAAAVGQALDQAISFAAGIEVLGNGDLGAALAAMGGHTLFSNICVGFGLLIMMSMMIIMMTQAMIVAEAAIVMTAGVFFLGFAGTRFTMPYTQGYLSYAVQVGAKLFTFWLIIGILKPMLDPIVHASIYAMAGAVIPFGFGSLAFLIPSAITVFQCMMLAALAWGVPNFAAGFLNGTSALNAGQVLTSSVGAMMGGATIMQSLLSKAQGNAGKAGEKRAAHEQSKGEAKEAWKNGEYGTAIGRSIGAAGTFSLSSYAGNKIADKVGKKTPDAARPGGRGADNEPLSGAPAGNASPDIGVPNVPVAGAPPGTPPALAGGSFEGHTPNIAPPAVPPRPVPATASGGVYSGNFSNTPINPVAAASGATPLAGVPPVAGPSNIVPSQQAASGSPPSSSAARFAGNSASAFPRSSQAASSQTPQRRAADPYVEDDADDEDAGYQAPQARRSAPVQQDTLGTGLALGEASDNPALAAAVSLYGNDPQPPRNPAGAGKKRGNGLGDFSPDQIRALEAQPFRFRVAYSNTEAGSLSKDQNQVINDSPKLRAIARTHDAERLSDAIQTASAVAGIARGIEIAALTTLHQDGSKPVGPGDSGIRT